MNDNVELDPTVKLLDAFNEIMAEATPDILIRTAVVLSDLHYELGLRGVADFGSRERWSSRVASALADNNKRWYEELEAEDMP